MASLTFHLPTPNLYRTGNILDVPFAHVGEGMIQFVTDLVMCVLGNTDPFRFRQHLQAGGDIDAVALDTALLNDNIAQIYADPKDQAPCLGYGRIAFMQRRLYFDGIADSFNDGGELNQQAVANGLDDRAVAAL